MIEKYPYAAQFTKESFGEFLRNSMIVFDTSVLLQFYKLTQTTRDHVLNILKHKEISPRLWLPSTIVEEYLKNRERVIRDTISRIEKTYDNSFGQSGLFATYLTSAEVKSELSSSIDMIVKKEIEVLSGYLEKDLVFQEFDILFQGDHIGERLSTEEYDQYKSEYKKRIDSRKETPGDEDQGKNNNKAGDFIIWKQLIKNAQMHQKNVIFITRDLKPDWWLITNKPIVIEKFVLQNEFYDESGQSIRIFEDVTFFELLTKYGIISEENNKTVDVLKKEQHSLDTFSQTEQLNKIAQSMSSPLFGPTWAQVQQDLLKNMRSPFSELSKEMEKGRLSLLQALTPFDDYSKMVQNYSSFLRTNPFDAISKSIEETMRPNIGDSNFPDLTNSHGDEDKKSPSD